MQQAVALGERQPPTWSDPDADLLRQLGEEHERQYLATLTGSTIRDLRHHPDPESTKDAMREGVEVIVQGTLAVGRWLGRPDLLIRVNTLASPAFGPWSYEVQDCKLARETKAATVLQLAHYSALLAEIQGVAPREMSVIPPGFIPERHRIADYAAICRAFQRQLEQAVHERPATEAEPNPHCDVCRYWSECDREWRRADHLSLTAGITRLQRKQLREWDIDTLTALAAMPIPLPQRPRHGARESYVRIREQARVQLQSRNINRPVHELLPLEENRGLARLPAPDPGDLFFDLESDPFTGRAGREYLFGVLAGDGTYLAHWALGSEAEEKAAFEWFIDLVDERRRTAPRLHVYHYAPKEPTALKALMGRHATREEALDRFLRAGVFVDLHSVTRQSLRAGVEHYSLKDLEPFHGFTRQVKLEAARTALHRMEHALQLGLVSRLPAGTVDTIQVYNHDDCLSTRSLRNWLETLRVEAGLTTRPAPAEEKPSEKVDQHNERTARLVDLLRDGQEPGSPRWLLSNVVDWHRRENKVAFWEKFRLQELPEDELLYEKDGLGELEFIRALEDRDCEYEFPPQETSLHEGDPLYSGDLAIGKIASLDLLSRRLIIRHSKKAPDLRPRAVYSYTIHTTDEQAGSLARFAEWLCAHPGLDRDGPFHASAALLRRDPPRLRSGTLRESGESALDAARRLALTLDRSVLPIQGPPGTGKTYTGARMILALVRAGRRVGVTATSHKVIRNLLDAVAAAALEVGQPIVCGHKTDSKSEHPPAWLREFIDNAKARAAFGERGECAVLGGTSWLWSRAEFAGSCDTLFIDEAGQMSLANALAVAPAARNLVLLGDPQQLDQPSRGSHPEGAHVSALEHLLDGAATITPDRGLFLAETRRLHPTICRFTSETFYDGRLTALAGLENQRLEGLPRLPVNGLVWLPVTHEGNQNRSFEEADLIQSLVNELLAGRVSWTNARSERVTLGPEHVMVVAPYNAQVNEIAGRLPGIAVGTVDKFQGQEAPVVIYSLTTSSPQDAPRGMEFLYSHHRLNVATSRAMGLAIVVVSSALLLPECRTPRHLSLANIFAKLQETGCDGLQSFTVRTALSRAPVTHVES